MRFFSSSHICISFINKIQTFYYIFVFTKYLRREKNPDDANIWFA